MTDPRFDAQVDVAVGKAHALFATLTAKKTTWLRPAALEYVAEIKRTLSKPGKGRIYKSRGIKTRLRGKGTKGRAKQMHRASAPGDPPAKDTGELITSVGIVDQPDHLKVGSPLAKAPALEYGTMGTGRPSLRGRRGPNAPFRRLLVSRLRRAGALSAARSIAAKGSGRLAPRPYMRPALERAMPKMQKLTEAAMQSVVRDVLGSG
jgi:hypothetical protein